MGVLLILVLLFVVAMIVRARARRPREPSCGQCGYPVAGLIRLRCPECGADLARVGIYTPSMRRPMGREGFVALWTLAVLSGGGLLSALVIQEVPGVLRRHESLSLLTSVSGAFSQIDLEISGRVDGAVPVPRRARIQLVNGAAPVGPALDVDMTTLIKASPWRDVGVPRPRQGTFSDREILALMAVAGADPTAPGPRAAAQWIHHELVHRAASWKPVGNRSIGGTGGLFSTETSRGSASAPLAWLVVPPLLIAWFVGVRRILRLTDPTRAVVDQAA